jgi:hypothetical protein
MATVVAVVVHCGRAFSGGTTAGVVDDMAGRRDGAPWPFGYRAVIIARARVPGRFGVVGSSCQWRTASPVVNAHDARGFGSADLPEL